MHQQLKLLTEILEGIDANPSTSMSYFTGACENTNLTTKPPCDIKWVLIKDTLHKIEHHFRSNSNCHEVDPFVEKVLYGLNDRYQQYQHLCWKSHETHFHKTVEEYINCPVTCLFELTEFLNKLIKEIFHQ